MARRNQAQPIHLLINGTANSWVSTTSLPSVRMGQIVAYNGYMYVLGGHNGAGTWYNDDLVRHK